MWKGQPPPRMACVPHGPHAERGLRTTAHLQDLTRFQIDQWIEWSNCFEDTYAHWLYFLLGQRPYAEATVVIEGATKRFDANLSVLETHLQGKDWTVGNTMTLAVRAQ
jgi:glutathione S-transferase